MKATPSTAAPIAGTVEEGLMKRLVRRCIPGLAASAVASLFTSICMLVLPLYMIQVFDRVLSSGSYPTLYALTAIAAGALIVFGLLEYGRGKLHTLLANWVYRQLNLGALQAMVSGSLGGKRDANQTLRDIAEIRRFVASRSVISLFEAIWSILFIIVAFLIHPVFGWIIVFGIVGLVIMAVLNQVLSSKPIADAKEASAITTSHLSGALRNSELIEALGLGTKLANRWRKAEEHNIEVGEQGHRRSSKISAASKSYRLILQIVALAAAAILILEGQVSPGSFIAIMMLLARALAPFEQLIDGWSMWVMAARAYRRVADVLNTAEQSGAVMVYPRPSGNIEVDRLVYMPPGADSAVLRGVSFGVEAGQAIGIVGPSAAGKSTLARLILGVVKPNVGAVRLDGQDVTQWNREDLGRYLGYLPQEPSLFDGTIRENIARLTDADPLDVIEAAKLAGVHEIIGRLPQGYETQIGFQGHVLTGGQKQRIALARALFGNPAIIVLDEPDANLDREGEAALRHAIRQMTRRGASVLIISHRDGVLQEVDKILVLDAGVVRQFGEADDLRPKLAQASRPAVEQENRLRIASAGAGRKSQTVDGTA